MTAGATVAIHVRLKPPVAEQLKAAAEIRGVAQAWLAARLIERGLALIGEGKHGH